MQAIDELHQVKTNKMKLMLDARIQFDVRPNHTRFTFIQVNVRENLFAS